MNPVLDQHVQKKRKLRLSDWTLFVLILSLVSVFWQGGRVVLSTGNLVPFSLLLGGGVFITLFPAFMAVEKDFVISFPRKLGWALAVFGSYFLADLLNGTFSGKEMDYLKLLSLIFWSFILFNLLTRHNIERALKLFILVGVTVTIIGLVRFLLYHPHNYLNLFEADLRGRNASAHALLIWATLLLGYVATEGSLFSRWMDRVLLVFFLSAMVLTLSRGALIAFLLVAGVAWLRTIRIDRKKTLAILVVLALFIVSFMVTSRLFPNVLERFRPSSVFTLSNVTETGARVSNETRWTLAKIGVRMVFDQPWGFGLHSFPWTFFSYIRPGDYLPLDREVIFSPHVEYLDVAVQGGVLGLILFLYFLRPFASFSLMTLTRPVPALYLAVGLVWGAHLIYFFFTWPIERIMFWTFVAITLALFRDSAFSQQAVDS